MTMKKIISFLLIAVMALSLVACGSKEQPKEEKPQAEENGQQTPDDASENNGAAGKYIPGTYSATEQGFGGDVTVTITVNENEITDVVITGENETPGIGGEAITALPDVIKAANSAEFDGVSGATLTSTAVKNAVAKALNEAMGIETPAAANMTAGTYKATAKGFYGDFEVEVTVDESKIVSVKAGENAETPDLGGKAIALLENDVVEYNTAGVDAITGATLTSRAMLSAVTTCLKEAGAPESLFAKVEYPAQEVTKDADVVVVGAGAAGFSSAIAAAENGAKVILIEKQGVVGGSTLISAGIVYAPVDEADIPEMEKYYQDRAEGKADDEIVNFFAEHALGTIDFFNESGVEWFMTAPSGTAPQPRARFAAGFSGASLIGPMSKRAEKAGVEVITNCKGTEIVTADGKVTGLKAEGRGISYTFNTKSVIIATGGFDASEEMKAEYSPIAVGDFPLSNKGNLGEGIKMGMAVGADTEFKGGIIGFDIVDGSLNNSGQSGISMGAPIYVGSDGGYIINNIDYPITHTALHASGYDSFFGIYDAAGEANGEAAIALGFGYKADSVEELAKACGMDADKLADAVSKSEALANAPYYAVVVKPATIGSMGGLKINSRAEVLDKNGAPIGGLYAAGEAANGGLYYIEYPASGTSNSMSITFGLEAGRNAASYVAE